MSESDGLSALRSNDSNNFEVCECDVATPRSSCKKVAGVINKFDIVNKNLVKEIDFGGILDLPQINKIDRKFTVLLLCNIDHDKRTIMINAKLSLSITASDVIVYSKSQLVQKL